MAATFGGVRADRDAAMLAGTTGNQLAESAHIARRNVYPALRNAGYGHGAAGDVMALA